MIKTKVDNFILRYAKEEDSLLILNLIKQLAEYENLLEEVTATEEDIRNTIFIKKHAEVIFGEYMGQPVGFTLFFHNYSTFLGKAGLYIEDLYIKEEMRGKGFGKIMISYLAKLSIQRGCGRLEWACLDWNKPSIEFYQNLGANPMDEWTVYRMTGERLHTFAEFF